MTNVIFPPLKPVWYYKNVPAPQCSIQPSDLPVLPVYNKTIPIEKFYKFSTHPRFPDNLDNELLHTYRTKKEQQEHRESYFYSECSGTMEHYETFESIPDEPFDLDIFKRRALYCNKDGVRVLQRIETTDERELYNHDHDTDSEIVYHTSDIRNMNPNIVDYSKINKIMLLHDEYISQDKWMGMTGLASWADKIIRKKIKMLARSSLEYQSTRIKEIYELENLIGSEKYASLTEIVINSRVRNMNGLPVDYINQYLKTHLLASKMLKKIKSITKDCFVFLEPDDNGYLRAHIFVFNKNISIYTAFLQKHWWQWNYHQSASDFKVICYNKESMVKSRLCAIRSRMMMLCIDNVEFDIAGSKIATCISNDMHNVVVRQNICMSTRIFNSLLWFFGKRNTPYKAMRQLSFSKSISSDIKSPKKTSSIVYWFEKWLTVNGLKIMLSKTLDDLRPEQQATVKALLAEEEENLKKQTRYRFMIRDKSFYERIRNFNSWFYKNEIKNIGYDHLFSQISAVNNLLEIYQCPLDGPYLEHILVQKSNNEAFSFGSILNFQLAPDHLIDGLRLICQRMVIGELPSTHKDAMESLYFGLMNRNRFISALHKHQIRHYSDYQTVRDTIESLEYANTWDLIEPKDIKPLVPRLTYLSDDKCLEILSCANVYAYKITLETPIHDLEAEMTRLKAFLQKPLCSKVIEPVERCSYILDLYYKETGRNLAFPIMTMPSVIAYNSVFGSRAVVLD